MDLLLDSIIAVKNIILAFIVSWLRFFFARFYKKSVTGEIVLITGAGNGMGREMAIEFAELGAILVLWDIDQVALEETSSLLKEKKAIFHNYTCDVSDRNEIRQVADKVRSEVGDVTMLVNSAGVVVGKKIQDLTDEEIEKTFGVNLFGLMWTTKEFLPSMMENNHGHIINMASSCGIVGLNKLTDYSSSKFGVVGFTQTLNYELHFSGNDGVYTTLVCPSYVTTGMFEGCKMFFPLLIPDLLTKDCVKQIMNAILTNQDEVYIPRMVYFLNTIKTLLPVSAMLEVIRFFRAHKFMESFVGRSRDESESSERKEE